MIFWSDIRSEVINIRLNDENVPGFLNGKFYDDCGVKKTCFGIPLGCVKTKNCQYIGTFKLDGGKHSFELKSPGKDEGNIFKIYFIILNLKIFSISQSMPYGLPWLFLKIPSWVMIQSLNVLRKKIP